MRKKRGFPQSVLMTWCTEFLATLWSIDIEWEKRQEDSQPIFSPTDPFPNHKGIWARNNNSRSLETVNRVEAYPSSYLTLISIEEEPSGWWSDNL